MRPRKSRPAALFSGRAMVRTKTWSGHMKGRHAVVGVSGLFASLAFGAIAVALPRPARAQGPLPERLADSTFWRLVTTFSEPSGYFASDNYVSNENEWQYV